MTEDTPSLKRVLIEDRWKIILVLILLSMAGLFFGFQPTIPRIVKLFALAVTFGIVLGFAPAIRIVNYLYTPDHTYLVDFNAENDTLAIWELPASTWRDLDVEDEIYPLEASHPTWEGRNYDPETNAVQGTWRGSATDVELVESRERINEIRTDLEQMAKEGLSIRIRQSSIVRSATKEVIMEFVADFEEETIYSGEEIQNRVDQALDRWDIDEPKTEQDDLDDTQDDQSFTEPNMSENGDQSEAQTQ